MTARTITRSVTKSIDIQAPVAATYSFLADPLNWPRWAVVNMRSVSPGKDGWYNTVTRFGNGQLRMNADEKTGLLDHTWKDPQATWTVPARVVPNGEGATFIITIFQPAAMSDDQFEGAMKEMDVELARLKELLEDASR